MNPERKGFVALLMLKAFVISKNSWPVFGATESRVIAHIAEINEISSDTARDFISFVNHSIKRHGPRGLPRVMTEKQCEIADTCLRNWVQQEGFIFEEEWLTNLTHDLCTRENDIKGNELIEYWARVMVSIIVKRCLPDSIVVVDEEELVC